MRESIAEEIVRNAVSACAHDPRFSPVTPDELDMLDVSVDVLTAPVPVKSVSELDVRKYGIIVESGYKREYCFPTLTDRRRRAADGGCQKKSGHFGRGGLSYTSL